MQPMEEAGFFVPEDAVGKCPPGDTKVFGSEAEILLGDAAKKDMLRLELFDEDWVLRPLKLIFCRKDKYAELRQSIIDTYPNVAICNLDILRRAYSDQGPFTMWIELRKIMEALRDSMYWILPLYHGKYGLCPVGMQTRAAKHSRFVGAFKRGGGRMHTKFLLADCLEFIVDGVARHLSYVRTDSLVQLKTYLDSYEVNTWDMAKEHIGNLSSLRLAYDRAEEVA